MISDNEENTQNSQQRGEWGSRIEFVLSCIGFAIGLGNVWRFPYIAYKNGGAAFVIPYIILLLFVGKPIYFLEVAMGQFCSLGSLEIWRCCPIAIGIGMAMQVVCCIVSIYYTTLVAYTVFYMAVSFASELPWQNCFEWWGPDDKCFVRKPNSLPPCSYLKTNITPGVTCELLNSTRQTSSEQFWNRYVLHIHESNGIDNIGNIRWDLTLCLLFSWIIIFVCLCKGIQTSGKAVYFTVLFPFLILIVLLIRGVTLEGASIGLYYLFVPKWSQLLEIGMWKNAAEQMFYSLGSSWGCLIMFGSYNDFRYKVIYTDTLIVTFVDLGTSLLACVAIFTVLGHLSLKLHLDISTVATKGPGLVFVVYPEAMALLPINQLWAIMFFLMLFTLGLDSLFCHVETILSNIYDYWPKTRNKKPLVTLIGCLIFFLLGLSCVTNGGQYVLTLLDTYGPAQSIVVIAICETISFSWIYGARRIKKDIEFMLNIKLSIFWLISWSFVCPISLFAILVLSFIYNEPLTYGDYQYPTWALNVGWAIEILSITQIPIWALINLFIYWKRGQIKSVFRPSINWGPADPKIREEWLIATQQSMEMDNPVFTRDNSMEITTRF